MLVARHKTVVVCRGAIYRARKEDFKHGRPMGRPYITLFLWVAKDHHVILHTDQHAAFTRKISSEGRSMLRPYRSKF